MIGFIAGGIIGFIVGAVFVGACVLFIATRVGDEP